jgi:hypothetical protein
VDRDLLIQHLRMYEQAILSFSGSQHQDQRLENYLVRGIIDYDDTSYDDHAEVQAKKDAAVQWCHHATTHALRRGGKPWKYQLIPHDAISENMMLLGLANQYHID